MSKLARMMRAVRMRQAPPQYAALEAKRDAEAFAALRRTLATYGQNPEAMSFLVSSGSLTEHDRAALEKSQADGRADFALCVCAACIESGPFSARRKPQAPPVWRQR